MQVAVAVDSPELVIVLRPMQDEDTDLIYSSWIRAFCANKSVHPSERSWLFAAQRALVDKLLQRADVIVACQPDIDDQVYGYIVHGPGRVLHWVYVKDIFRRAHVGTRLMLSAFGDFNEHIHYTHRTASTTHYRKRWNLYSNTRALETICRGVTS